MLTRTSTFRVATLEMTLQHYNCIVFIMLPPLTERAHALVMLKTTNRMRKECLVNKT